MADKKLRFKNQISNMIASNSLNLSKPKSEIEAKITLFVDDLFDNSS